jgi:hypothetical protein
MPMKQPLILCLKLEKKGEKKKDAGETILKMLEKWGKFNLFFVLFAVGNR